MFQHGLDLFPGHAGEPLEKIIHPGAILQIGEEGLHRNSRAAEQPGPTDLLQSSLDRRALIRIHHRERLRERITTGKLVEFGTDRCDVSLVFRDRDHNSLGFKGFCPTYEERSSDPSASLSQHAEANRAHSVSEGL